MEDAETQTITSLGDKPATRVPDLDRGTVVARYVILDVLGYGGMGVVYRAYDPDLDRRVALKLVREQTKDKTERLVKEAQALAKVSHPNIVQIFDVGVFRETVFIAMELVEGETLLEWVAEAKPTWRPLLAHLVEAGRGLAAAHAAGLVHRDFKPANAIVGRDGRVRVLDFGLATPTESATGGEDTASPTDPESDEGPLPSHVLSKLVGTPSYMAPEQRKRGSIDARADQFAYAVACWELLHDGQMPFSGDTPKRYAKSVMLGRFAPPPAGNRTPAWVRAVLLRAMAPAPADRYRTLDAMLDALGRDPAKRRRTIAAVAGGVLAIGAAVAFAIVSRGAAAPPPCEDAARHMDGIWDQTVAGKVGDAFHATGASFADETTRRVTTALDARRDAWTAMHREACRATNVSHEQSATLLDLRMACLARRRDELHALVDELAAAKDGARVAGSIDAVAQLPSVAACADREALAAAVPPPDDPAKRRAIDAARAELAKIQALLATGQWTAARDRAEKAAAAAKPIGYAPLDAETGFELGTAEHQLGNLAAAEAALVAAVQAAARAHLDDLAVDTWSELAMVVGYEETRPAEGLAFADAAEAAAARAESERSVQANLAHTRALVLMTKGDNDAALTEGERALALFEGSPQGDNRDHDAIDVLNTIAMIDTARGDYAKAEVADREVLARRRTQLGEGHPKIADALDNLGVVRAKQGATDEAKQLYEAALAIRVAGLGPDARDVGTSHNNLGGLLLDTGTDDAGAAKHLEEALRIYEATLGPDHEDLAIPLTNLGELATRRKDYAHAIAYCTRAQKLDETSAPDDPKVAYDLVCLGEAQLGSGDTRAATTALSRALELRTKEKETDEGELARTRFDLAQALPPSQRTVAVGLATQALAKFPKDGAAWQRRAAAATAWLRSHHRG